MRQKERTADRLVLRASGVWPGLILLALALLCLGFALADILTERGENGGWFVLPVGLVLAPLAVLLLLSPVEYVLNRTDGTLLHIRRGPWERVLKRHEVPGLHRASASKIARRSGPGGSTWRMQLLSEGRPVTLQAAGSRRSAERLATRVNDWLGAER
ncbi:hypothetical protein [Vannielia litorea]|uniref:hypothetical protein n=1 Tax=Vannielia litorea TaxID=1217970 RepID=UPI001C93CA96|nr:hypothetical protein [Vannielia litorea]MBY6046096.1 hypothetical protein [Vannielia litorea]MBY6073509.1 hypothetical protein [Vannielia litorea]